MSKPTSISYCRLSDFSSTSKFFHNQKYNFSLFPNCTSTALHIFVNCVNFFTYRTENISIAKNTTFHWPQFLIYLLRNFVIQLLPQVQQKYILLEFYYTFTVLKLYIFAVHNIKENSILPVQRKKQMTQAISSSKAPLKILPSNTIKNFGVFTDVWGI